MAKMPSAVSKPPAGRGKRTVAYLLVLVATLSAFLAIFAVWANRQALNTDNFTETSTELLESEPVREQLSIFLVNELYDNVDVQGELTAVLPGRAKVLAAPAANGLRGLAQDGADQLLAQPKAQQAWEKIVRRGHHALLNVLDETGEGEVVRGGKGTVTLDLRELLIRTAKRVGLSGNLIKELPKDAAQLEILRSDQLEAAQDGIGFVRRLPLILIGLMLILFVTAVSLARGHRRRIVRAGGIGLVVAGAAALLAHDVGGDELVDALASTEAVKPAVADVWTISTSLLVAAATATIGYGVVVILAAALAGPTRVAAGLRGWLSPYLAQPALAFGGLGILVVLVIAWGPTPATRQFVPMLTMVVFLAIGFEMLRRQTAREHPDAAHGKHPSARAHLAGLADRARAGFENLSLPDLGGSDHGGSDDRIAALERLAKLKAEGVLDDDEFAREKRRILGDDS